MLVEIPLGDVVDRITILALKVERVGDPVRAGLAGEELAALRDRWQASLPPIDDLAEAAALAAVNGSLWEVEDALRVHEAAGDFGPGFVALARRVMALNDERARLKRSINVRLGSRFVEVKSYGEPRSGREGR